MVRFNEKRLIRFIFAAIIVILFFLMAIERYKYEPYLFLASYLVMGYITFYISPYWLSSLTMFYVMMTDGLAMGIVFYLSEDAYLFFNPFLIIIVGYGFLLLGYFVASKTRIAKHLLKHRFLKIKNINIQPKAALIISFVLSAMLGAMYLYSNRNILFTSMEDGRIQASSGNGLLVYAIQLQVLIIPCMYIEYKNKRFSGNLLRICFVISAIELLGIGFRTPLFRMISIILCMMILTKELKFGKAICIVFVLIIALLGLGTIRSGNSYSGFFSLLRSHWLPGAYNLNTMFRCFPKLVDFQHGYTYLINLIMLRPGPDLDFTLWLKEAAGMSFSGGGLTPTLFGEFYINFGIIGMYMGMFLVGMFFRYIDNLNFKGKVGFWSAFSMMYCSAVFGGGIANVMVLVLVLVLYYWFLSLVIDKKYSFTIEQ